MSLRSPCGFWWDSNFSGVWVSNGEMRFCHVLWLIGPGAILREELLLKTDPTGLRPSQGDIDLAWHNSWVRGGPERVRRARVRHWQSNGVAGRTLAPARKALERGWQQMPSSESNPGVWGPWARPTLEPPCLSFSAVELEHSEVPGVYSTPKAAALQWRAQHFKVWRWVLCLYSLTAGIASPIPHAFGRHPPAKTLATPGRLYRGSWYAKKKKERKKATARQPGGYPTLV